MKIVIDSNILFSALIKNSTTRNLILESNRLFLFPSYIFIEMEKHKDELFTKSKMNKNEFNKLLQLLLNKIVIVPAEVLKQYKEKAFNMVK